MSAPIVVEVERCGFRESEHLVDVAVVNEAGALVAFCGEPHRHAAFRSSAKPIQARVCLENGWSPDARALAIACSSHNGESVHVAVVRAILEAAGLGEDELRCPPDIPADPDATLQVGARSPLYHYCSGKHASMLATCVANNWEIQSYCDPSHPLQTKIRARIAALTRYEDVLIDGCGAPTFVAPLPTLAAAFRVIDDGGPEAAAMRAHPFLVAGSGRLDTDLMTVAPHILVKYGAEGIVCVAAGRYGIALKTRDGDGLRASGPATLLVLRELGLLDDDQVAKLAHHFEPAVLGGQTPVGRARARGHLERC